MRSTIPEELPRDEHANLDETAAVARLLKDRRGSKHVMLDVGAHYGSSAAYFHELGWTIHCFEPDAANRAQLMARFGKAENVIIDARALSDRASSKAAFFTSGESSGISGLHAFHASHKESDRVDVATVADIQAERRIDHVDFLKIDVEGFDFSVLKGVAWERLQPDVIECEFEDAKTIPLGHTWREVADFLKNKGYAVYLSEWHPVIRYGVRHDWRRVIPMEGADVPASAWGNILAFRNDPGLPAIRAAFQDGIHLSASSDIGGSTHTATTIRSYAPYAERLRKRAPQLFALLRFGKKAAGSLWRRRALTAPAALVFATWMLAGFLPALAPSRWIIWGTGLLGLSIAATGYVALRLHQFMERTAHELLVLRRSLAIAQQETRTKIAELGRQTSQTIEALSKHSNVADTLAQRITGVDRAFVFNNSIWYQRFNRRLNQKIVHTLADWTQSLPVKITQQMIGYAAHRACLVEARMHGRLATSIEDVLLRTYAAMSVKRPNLEVLEIGTLFGIGAGIMYDALTPHFDNVRMTLLDPLDGYYGAKQLDISTGRPISEATLRANLEEVGLTGANLSLIKHLSTDKEAIEIAGQQKYDVLVIDGDHTYQGVKADFDLYARMVRPGGIIIFDDYGSEDWPDIQRYVDNEIEPLEFVERLVQQWRTCVYRVKHAA